jgi:hypothetical protein
MSFLDGSQAIKLPAHQFTPETPLDETLSYFIARQHVGRMYNPTAFYVKKRRVVIDWMCEMGEDLKFDPETIHHSIGVFDSYFQIANIQDHLDGFEFTKGKSSEQVIQLVAVVCMFISAKYGEKTYPGVQKLNQII